MNKLCPAENSTRKQSGILIANVNKTYRYIIKITHLPLRGMDYCSLPKLRNKSPIDNYLSISKIPENQHKVVLFADPQL